MEQQEFHVLLALPGGRSRDSGRLPAKENGNHMRIALALPALAAMGLAALGAATPKTKVVVTSTSKTDTPAKKGEASSQAAAWARTLEIFFAEAMTDKFPCSSSMTPSDLSDLLGYLMSLRG